MSEAALSIVRLLQLASPALPVGAYSYSQGLEWMIASGEIDDASAAKRWLGDSMEHVLAIGDVPVVLRLLDACDRHDALQFATWNTWYRASRETRELRAETEQMGEACVRLARGLDIFDHVLVSLARDAAPVTFPAAFSLTAHAMDIPADDALAGYVMSWLENQVLVIMKTLPLGQVAGQRLLYALASDIPDIITRARRVADEDVVGFAPGLAFASSCHETQYSRLFRS